MMADAALDNPFWSALSSLHREVALGSQQVRRYPSEYAPFLGVLDASVESTPDLSALVAPGEAVYLLGVTPVLPKDWRSQAFRPLAQMFCESPLPVPEGPDILPLGEAARAEVLALTALVYPHFFRTRTMDLGRYFGIYVEGRLAAMIGERLGSEDCRELSAICTHPDFLGRGYARRLTTWLNNDILAQGRQPFLHVSYENTRAKALYEQLGFRTRRDIAFYSLQRPD